MDKTERANVPDLGQPSEMELPDKFPAGLRIIVVDTNRLFLMDMMNMMSQCKYEVTSFQNAKKALSTVKRGKYHIDIVVWNLHMPGIDAQEILKTIGSKLPVIIVSADYEKGVVMKCIENGACDYLVKPVSQGTIAVIWQHVVRWKKNHSPNHSGRPKFTQSLDFDLSHDQIGQTEDDAKASLEVQYSRGSKRMRWNPDLEKKFLAAVNKVGDIKKARPLEILRCMEEMNVHGLTQEQVANHLQTFREKLKRKETPDFIPLGQSNTSAFNLSSFSSSEERNNVQPSLSSINPLLNDQTSNLDLITPHVQDYCFPGNDLLVRNLPSIHFPYRYEPSLQVPQPTIPDITMYQLSQQLPQPLIPDATMYQPSQQLPQPLIPDATMYQPSLQLPQPTIPDITMYQPSQQLPQPLIPDATMYQPSLQLPQPPIPNVTMYQPSQQLPQPLIPDATMYQPSLQLPQPLIPDVKMYQPSLHSPQPPITDESADTTDDNVPDPFFDLFL